MLSNGKKQVKFDEVLVHFCHMSIGLVLLISEIRILASSSVYPYC